MESSSQTSGAELREELRGDAQTVTDSAKQKLQSEVDARKGGAADQAKSLSSALDTAAGELSDSPQWLRSAFQQGAQTLQRFADTIEQKDSRQLTADVQRLARENPGTFLAGCAVAGFAAARVLKAGVPDGTGEPGSGTNSGQSQSYSQGGSAYGQQSASGSVGNASAGSPTMRAPAYAGDRP